MDKIPRLKFCVYLGLLFCFWINCDHPNKSKKSSNNNQNNHQHINQNSNQNSNLNQNNENTSLSEQELCVLYLISYHWDIDDNYCKASKLILPEELSTKQIDFYCGPGSEGMVFAETLQNSIAEQRVLIDWKLAKACIKEAHELRSQYKAYELITHPEWEALKNGVCSDFYQGLVPKDHLCVHDWDCVEKTHGCYTNIPYENNSRICMPKGSLNESCRAWFHPCKQGLQCVYVSGDYVCYEKNFVALGEICKYSKDCLGPCTQCHPITKTCVQMKPEQAFCNTWFDCFDDLGCTDGQCQKIGLGEDCGLYNWGRCESDLVCAHRCFQHQEPSQCEADGCIADWDYSVCMPPNNETPTCQTLAKANTPCTAGIWCEYDHYCDPSGICRPYAEKGDACYYIGDYQNIDCTKITDEHACQIRQPPCYYDKSKNKCVPAPYCQNIFDAVTCNSYPGFCRYQTDTETCVPIPYCPDHVTETECLENNLQCVWDNTIKQCQFLPLCYMAFSRWCTKDRICTKLCSENEECEANEYCDFYYTGICQPMRQDACTTSRECPEHQYCPRCLLYGNQNVGFLEECEADPKCVWTAEGTSNNYFRCVAIDENQTYACIDKKAVGEYCVSTEECVGKVFTELKENGQTKRRCAYDRNIYIKDDFIFLQMIFILGGVWIVIRRRKFGC